MVVGLGLGLGSVVGVGPVSVRILWLRLWVWIRQWLWPIWLRSRRLWPKWLRSGWLWSIWRCQPIQSFRTTTPTATRRLLPWIRRWSPGAANAERNPGVRTGPRRRELSWILPAELEPESSFVD